MDLLSFGFDFHGSCGCVLNIHSRVRTKGKVHGSFYLILWTRARESIGGLVVALGFCAWDWVNSVGRDGEHVVHNYFGNSSTTVIIL